MENFVGRVKPFGYVQDSNDQDSNNEVLGFPVLGGELEGVDDTQEALQGDGHCCPPTTPDHEIVWLSE